MKKVLVCAVAAALVCGMAAAQGRIWDDLSWWAESGATPDPVKDATRSGYWWWPTEPASNVDDSELWGNRGVVYHIWTPSQPVEPPKPPPPKPPVAQSRQKPVLNNVLFDFDKYDIKPEGKTVVNEVVSYMKQYSKDTAVVVGHTDSIGTEEYNMALGQRRADAIKQYMVQNGIAASRITTVSKGESQPVKPNDTAANRRLNRRAVFDITVRN